MIIEANRHWQYTDTESGLIMPWYTLPMLEWLKKQDISKWDVYEFGCGYSTAWWRVNCDFIWSVDSNEVWARAMNVTFCSHEVDYIKCDVGHKFDCVVIDGSWRESCVKSSFDKIKPAGFLIIDNYGQEDFPPEACERTEKLLAGWSKQVFKQPNHSEWCTALFQKPR